MVLWALHSQQGKSGEAVTAAYASDGNSGSADRLRQQAAQQNSRNARPSCGHHTWVLMQIAASCGFVLLGSRSSGKTMLWK